MNEEMMDYKKLLISAIREYWFYEAGVLEAMTLSEIEEIYNDLVDWIN